MQSLNEELNTVNSELNSKLEDLSQSNDDMQNLLNSTRIATIFMDMNMNVLRFTEQATQLIMLRDSDVGRPVHELASNLKETSIADDCRDVLKTLIPQDKEVQSTKERWYLMRILPYRTAENTVAGLVMTFVDIDQLKRGRDTVAYLSSIFDTMREPLAILDHEMRLATCNHAFYRMFQTDEPSCRGQLFMDLPTARWDTPKLRRLLEELLPNQTTIEDFKFTAEVASLGTCHFTLNARRLERESGLPEMILLAFERVVEP